MQILLKWRISVFVMLVLKKRIRFTESLPPPDSEGFWTQLKDLRQTMMIEGKKDRFMQRMPVMKLQRGWYLWLFSEKYTNYADHSCIKKKDSVDFFLLFLSLPLWIVLVCIVFNMHLTFFPSWMRQRDRGFFWGGRLIKKYFQTNLSCHDMNFTHHSTISYQARESSNE